MVDNCLKINVLPSLVFLPIYNTITCHTTR